MRSLSSKFTRALSWRHAKEVYIAGLLTVTLKVVLFQAGYDLNMKGMLILGSFNYLSVSFYFWFRNAGFEVVKAKITQIGLQPMEGKNMMTIIKSRLMRQSGNELARTLRLTAVAMITALFYFSIDTPTHDVGIKLQHLVVLLGVTYALTRPVIMAIRAPFANGLSIADLMLSTTAMVPGLVAAVWAIGEYADTVILILDREPVMVATYAAALGLVLVAAQFTKLLFGSGADHHSSRPITGASLGYASVSHAGTTNNLSKRDIEYVAAHEAGHLMTMAAFDELPDSFEVKIASSPDGVNGFVVDIDNANSLQERNYWEWRMVKLLAGREGELFAFGTHTLGSASDHSKWLQIAKDYLGNHEHGLFYDSPSNAVELKRNEEQLEALKAKQLKLLHQLFVENSTIFDRLRDALADKRTLHRDEVTELLRCVRLPQGFPAPIVGN
jgi:hypothetical protein